MSNKTSGRLMNFVLFMAIVCFTTIATVFTSHEATAHKQPVEMPMFVPQPIQGSMKALIDLRTGSVLELSSDLPITDLEVTVNHPEVTEQSEIKAPTVEKEERVYNHYFYRTVKDTVKVNEYPVLKFNKLKAPVPQLAVSPSHLPEYNLLE